MPNKSRLIYIDHARAFLFLLMVVDHALHAYAENWGYFWFFQDYARSVTYDYLYLFNQAIIMPGIFFIVGMFVIPSFQRRGLNDLIKEKLIRLGIPFALFIPLTVPLLSFPRYETYEQPSISYINFFTEVFWAERLQAGPLWVMQAMFFYILATVFIFSFTPFFFQRIKSFFSWARKRPVPGIIGFIFISFLLLVICDLRWGAPWWIKLFGFLRIEGWDVWNKFIQLFSVQASRFLMLFWYTLSGAAIMQLGWFHDKAFMDRFSYKVFLWVGGTILGGIAYTHFSMSYFHEGAYNQTIRDFLSNNGSWRAVPEILFREGELVIVRNVLLATLSFFQLATLIAVFYKLNTAANPFWNKMAAGAYAIFLTHETFVVWMQYALIDIALPTFIKFILTLSIGFGLSWIVVHYILLKVKTFRRVLNPALDAKNM